MTPVVTEVGNQILFYPVCSLRICTLLFLWEVKLNPLYSQGLTPNSVSHNIDNNASDIELLEFDDINAEKMMVMSLLHLGFLCCFPNSRGRSGKVLVIELLHQIVGFHNGDYAITDMYSCHSFQPTYKASWTLQFQGILASSRI